MALENVGGESEKLVRLDHEVTTLKQELLVQAELLENEKLERKAEVDRLRLELQTLKNLFEQAQPGFIDQLNKLYENERLNYDPELDKKSA
jgi:hypothetical protein